MWPRIPELLCAVMLDAMQSMCSFGSFRQRARAVPARLVPCLRPRALGVALGMCFTTVSTVQAAPQ